MFNGGPVSCYSKRQPTVALSSIEAEYIALTLAAKKQPGWDSSSLNLDSSRSSSNIRSSESRKGIPVQKLSKTARITLAGDSEEPRIIISLKNGKQGSIALAHNPIFDSRTKDIDIQHRYIWDEVAANRIQLSYVPTNEMIANGLTKALTRIKFHGFVEQMRMT